VIDRGSWLFNAPCIQTRDILHVQHGHKQQRNKHQFIQLNILLPVLTVCIIMGKRWVGFLLDYRPHNGRGFIPNSSYERIHNPGYKAKKRASKTLKHYVVKPGRYGSSS